ncbi:Hypothetical_protein [Hexamita inflata]|uniref:Hypothetical_protein n=1 Tax=Hexamita inflata TaxID=28002 RepID=A0AA86UCL8_9EUKA|nr:Hypothetical protein HINF_LOCUS33377 [Hexamita inflata]
MAYTVQSIYKLYKERKVSSQLIIKTFVAVISLCLKWETDLKKIKNNDRTITQQSMGYFVKLFISVLEKLVTLEKQSVNSALLIQSFYQRVSKILWKLSSTYLVD